MHSCVDDDGVTHLSNARNAAIDAEMVAEIVAASEDGSRLIYTDSENDRAGFVGIADPGQPTPLGRLRCAAAMS